MYLGRDADARVGPALGGRLDRGAKNARAEAGQESAALRKAGAHDADVDLNVGPYAGGGVVTREVCGCREFEQIDDAQHLHNHHKNARREHSHDAELLAQRHVECPELRHGQKDGGHVQDDGHDGGPQRLGLNVAAHGVVGAVPAKPCTGDGRALEDGDDGEGDGADGAQADDSEDADSEFLFGEDAQVEKADRDLGHEDDDEVENLRVVVHLEHKGDVVEGHHVQVVAQAVGREEVRHHRQRDGEGRRHEGHPVVRLPRGGQPGERPGPHATQEEEDGEHTKQRRDHLEAHRVIGDGPAARGGVKPLRQQGIPDRAARRHALCHLCREVGVGADARDIGGHMAC